MKVRADDVKRALAKRHFDDFFMTEVKNGPTQSVRHHLKMDAMAIKKSWAHPCITGYEVKVDRSDFTRDDKWPGYLSYCHQFSFACPAGLIQPEELPPEVGLVYYKPETGAFVTKRKPMYRSIEVPSEALMYIIMNKLDNDRHPFFSSNREFIEAYMLDREDKKVLGRKFSIKVTEELHRLREQVKELKRENERWNDNRQMFYDLRSILRQNGIEVDSWRPQWRDELTAMLVGSGSNPRFAREAKLLLGHAEALAKLLDPEPVK